MRFVLSLLSLLALFLASVRGQSAPNPPPIWPFQFIATFGMYDSPLLQPKIVNETSVLYYNIDQAGAQLIDYPTNCPVSPKLLSGTTQGCSVLFNSDPNGGIYLRQPAFGYECCKLISGVGPIPRNFTNGMSWKGVTTATDYFGNTHAVDHYNGGLTLFDYWTEVGTHHDIAFHDGAGPVWNFKPLNVTKVDPSIFDLWSDPATCNKSCFGLAKELGNEYLADDEEMDLINQWVNHGFIKLALHHNLMKSIAPNQN